MSGPVITGLPPDTLAQILELLQQFGITIVDLAQMGITTYEGAGGLKEFMLNNGWELKEVWDLKQMWFYTGAGNATESNALVQYVANELTIGGTAGAQYVASYSYGESTMGKLKKGVIFGSIFALLVSTLDPTMITDALKGRLNSTLDRFTDENDEIPVIIGADGKTYYHEEMINALRQALIDEGVYNTTREWESLDSNVNVTYSQYTNQTPVTSRTIENYYYNRLQANFPSFTPFKPTAGSNMDRIDTFIIRDSADYSHTVTVKPIAFVGYASPSGGCYACPIFDSSAFSDFTGYAEITRYEDSVGGGGASVTPRKIWKVNYNGTTICIGDIVGSDYVNGSDIGWTTSTMGIEAFSETDRVTYAAVAYLTSEGGTGVEGITVASDLINKGIGDISTSLEDVFDNYSTNYVTTMNPSDEDLEGKDKWYPVSSNNNDVWTHGITDTDSSKAPDGDIDTDLDDFISDAIRKIIDDYYRDPVDPGTINYPEIPVGDNGDTPPAEPPLISGSANGLWSIYNPTLTQVQNFGAYLWSENILDQITRMFNSPIDAVIGFHMIYCTPIKGPTRNIKCGYLDTGVASITVANQYATIDCGSVFVSEYYRTALDYNATKLALYLPFIGIVPLSTEVCVGSTLHVIYRIDVLTGTCLAQVKVIKQNSDAVMYAFEGNCAVQIPLTATTYTGTVTALINSVSAGLSAFMGDYISAGQDLSEAVSGAMSKTGVKQSGSLGANAGALGIRIPYLIITHPVAYDAIQYNTQYGFPLNETVTLGGIHGYTRVKDIHLSGIPCTDDELEQIETLLKDGVIIN